MAYHSISVAMKALAFVVVLLNAAHLSTAAPTKSPSSHAELLRHTQQLKSKLVKQSSLLPTTERQQTDIYNCNGVRNRRELRDLSTNEREDWAAALDDLRTEPSEFQGLSEWDALVLLHVIFSDEAHGGSYFLPWHRLFLLRLENAIRRSRPSFALPYWDWSVDASDAALSPIWGSAYAGGAVSGPRAIPNGPFANWFAQYPDPHTVTRNFNSGVSGSIPTLWNAQQVDDFINTIGDWGRFSDAVESAHDLPHVYIGGDMSTTSNAPNDPIFYLHHAFVDSLWSRRQSRTGDLDEFGGTHDFQTGSRTVSATTVFEAFDRTPQDAFDATCVNYVPYSGGVTTTTTTTTTTTQSDPTETEESPENLCTIPAFRNNRELTDARCRRAERLLRRSTRT